LTLKTACPTLFYLIYFTFSDFISNYHEFFARSYQSSRNTTKSTNEQLKTNQTEIFIY